MRIVGESRRLNQASLHLVFITVVIKDVMEELVKRVSDFVEMELRSGSMQLISAEYVARCMQIAKEDAAAALEALKK